jgi:uncharacterized protein YidB (DUF937 family)
MDKSSSQMLALLGLLAVAGYQNRDKLGDLLGGLTGGGATPPGTPGTKQIDTPAAQPQGGLGGILGGLFGGGGAPSPADANTGLQDIVDQFSKRGHAEEAQSWVGSGPNREIPSGSLEQALGADTVDALAKQTGLSREEILSRLSAVLPNAVDKMTPNGRLPDHKWSS